MQWKVACSMGHHWFPYGMLLFTTYLVKLTINYFLAIYIQVALFRTNNTFFLTFLGNKNSVKMSCMAQMESTKCNLGSLNLSTLRACCLKKSTNLLDMFVVIYSYHPDWNVVWQNIQKPLTRGTQYTLVQRIGVKCNG